MTKKRIISEEVLKELYLNQELRIMDIANQLHASGSTIIRNLDEYNIARRGYGELHTTHGMSDTRQYRIWQGIKTRCSNPNGASYQKYGARGISYPQKWETFEGFWDDMAPGYSDDKTIDRVDGSKDYSKDNCHWVDYKGQNRNKTDNVLLTYRGTTQCIAAWAEEVDISQTALYNRKRRGWPDEKILSTPVQKKYISNSSSSAPPSQLPPASSA